MKDAKTSNSTTLSLYIRELDKQEKEYQEFRVKINNNDWLNINLKNDESYETSKILIDNLLLENRYKIDAQYKYNNEWIDIPSCTFVTQENAYEKYPFIPFVNYRPSGIRMEFGGNPEPVKFTINQNLE